MRIDKRNIYISESDILDGSPVFDIKPYLPYSDSFPDAETGWVTTDMDKMFPVIFSAEAKKQTEWLNKKAGINLEGYASVQLSFNPFDTKRKRIKKLSSLSDEYLLAYRTWRILYQVDNKDNKVTVTGVISGYSEDELNDINNDKYGDKSLHREYLAEGFLTNKQNTIS